MNRVEPVAVPFGILVGRGTEVQSSCLGSSRKKYSIKNKVLFLAFVDLEKVFDSTTFNNLVVTKETKAYTRGSQNFSASGPL